ncbi:hypothetical protein AK830_g10179 [Neonectria ditissima]|uniref:Uncharacterized protein n=1 Tax=Neonectria ditissima TaxID=78410 RepID=A0A0P7B7Q6_9HYPO|nr:hypothetical protein AK830_g10179 [Neonectria ditissima]
MTSSGHSLLLFRFYIIPPPGFNTESSCLETQLKLSGFSISSFSIRSPAINPGTLPPPPRPSPRSSLPPPSLPPPSLPPPSLYPPITISTITISTITTITTTTATTPSLEEMPKQYRNSSTSANVGAKPAATAAVAAATPPPPPLTEVEQRAAKGTKLAAEENAATSHASIPSTAPKSFNFSLHGLEKNRKADYRAARHTRVPPPPSRAPVKTKLSDKENAAACIFAWWQALAAEADEGYGTMAQKKIEAISPFAGRHAVKRAAIAASFQTEDAEEVVVRLVEEAVQATKPETEAVQASKPDQTFRNG